VSPNNNLELLSPAKNLECGLAAIRHGADAVYIGAPRFGAREAAGNSIEEIEKLATEARLFGAKTYVALNTVLFDHELAEAEKMIRQIYEAGADALIIQDFGILEMDLPPISLHASTQANNFTAAKIKFLEAVGFERAVLARELSLQQIEAIAAETTIELEAFVHGSLCVSLSGQCYMSHALGGRSANRGACAQPCRKKYNLTDANGATVVREKHLLSLKDLNRSGSIAELAAAGVRSFKIEGRLKDLDYVKNITAYYRRELDRLLEGKPDFLPASLGKTTLFFTPDPAKTFHRHATEYFLHGRKESVAAMDSPKSTGEELGIVTGITRDSIRIGGSPVIANNDGLTFISRNGESKGLKVNKVTEGIIYPDKMNDIFVGARIFRNYDHSFQMELSRKTAERKIPVSMSLLPAPDGFILRATQGDQAWDYSVKMEKITANDPAKSRENILRQLAKAGDTPFLVREINTGGNERFFFTSQQLNEMRRGLLEQIHTARTLKSSQKDKQNSRTRKSNSSPFPVDSLHFENNITNRLAVQFYRRHGVENPDLGVERSQPTGRLQVMITRHCLQHELGFCQRYGGNFPSHLSLPFSLQDGTNHFELEFDCRNCLMKVFLETSGRSLDRGQGDEKRE